jgi:hypothetical protein
MTTLGFLLAADMVALAEIGRPPSLRLLLNRSVTGISGVALPGSSTAVRAKRLGISA